MSRLLQLTLVTFFILCQNIVAMDIRFEIKSFSDCTDQDFEQISKKEKFQEFTSQENRVKALDGFLIRAFDDEQLVGAMIGLSFASTMNYIKEISFSLARRGLKLEERYYFEVFFIHPEYRGKKIISQLFYKLGEQISTIETYKKICYLNNSFRVLLALDEIDIEQYVLNSDPNRKIDILTYCF